MVKGKVEVLWSNQAKADLKDIFDWVLRKTESLQDATTTRTDIINRSKEINVSEVIRAGLRPLEEESKFIAFKKQFKKELTAE